MIARVYQAVNAVAAALAENGVAKTRLNSRDNYLYRSIDDVLQRLAPLLAQHRLCILPRVLEREANERQDENGGRLLYVSLRVAFDLVSAEDGSSHTIEAFGEALDAGDKGTAKAMQAAFKYAVLQTFCVPTAQQKDADALSHRLVAPEALAIFGDRWERWCEGMKDELRALATMEAFKALQDGRRFELAALARERPDLYKRLGKAFAGRARQLEPAPKARGKTTAHPAPTTPLGAEATPQYAPSPSVSAGATEGAPTALPASSAAQLAPAEAESSTQMAHCSLGDTAKCDQISRPSIRPRL